MMTSRRLLGLLCAATALAGPAAASGASGNPAELRLSSFRSQDSNGYEIEVISVRDGSLFPTAAVRAERKSLEASYEVRAEVGPGIHATFGSLGQLDVSFERRRKEIDRPEKGCRWIFESGVFRGSFRFVGEGGYVSSEATDPAGEVLRLPNGFCGLGDFRRARPFFDLRQTVLAAKSKVGDVSFTASRFAGDRTTFFTALLRERADGMEILRRASARGREGTFFNTRASRASVLPPGPFDGSARFRDPADGPRSWIGSLSVSLPGAEEVALAGDAFAAKLCPRLSIFESCLRRPPRHASAAAASAYGSGSHSQPLALARLSSLR